MKCIWGLVILPICHEMAWKFFLVIITYLSCHFLNLHFVKISNMASYAHKTHVDSSTRQLNLVHMDACGPMPTRSFGGALYFITSIDDTIRNVWVYLIRGKDDLYPNFIK